MEIKRIEHLSKDECSFFLHNNPNGELAIEVQRRLNVILAAEEKERQREESERKTSIVLKNKWIDANQFLEKMKYRNLHGFRVFLLILSSLCLIIVFTTLFYTSSIHYIYSVSRSEQCSQTYGLENVLLNLQLIDTPRYSLEGDFPTWEKYEGGETLPIMILIGCFLLIMLLITNLHHSSLIGKIYYIGDGTNADIYRPIQNKQGRCGLCELGQTRLKKLLSFQYDLICPAKENSFVCCWNSKYGLYNAIAQKMVIPIEYDDIDSLEESVIKLVRNGEVFTYSYEGYRIIE